MRKIKISLALLFCVLLGVNSYAANAKAYPSTDNRPVKVQSHKNKTVHLKNKKTKKVVKHIKPAPKYAHYCKHPQKTVVVHHYTNSNRTVSPQAATAAAIIGLGVLTTAVIAEAIF